MEDFDDIYNTLMGDITYGYEVPGVDNINSLEEPYWKAKVSLVYYAERLLSRYGLELREIMKDAEGPAIRLAWEEMQREIALAMYRYCMDTESESE